MVLSSSRTVQQKLSDLYRHYVNDAGQGSLIKTGQYQRDSADFSETETMPLYSFQNVIRPLYNKGEPKAPDIGDHPDFRYLKGTRNQVHCAITTLFMDLEGSTRLNLIYPLEQVQQIKNSFIRAAIEIINAFDGHVHRIMGDAVMAFFGGTDTLPEQASIDAINCSAVLQMFAEQTVRPFLQSEGLDDPFGIRIGIDYGSAEKVLWSSYGYPGMDEVTATSFHVDVASKLQHSAGRNQIMIGQSLKEFLDFPDDLLNVKRSQQNGENVFRIYLEPNHTDKDGIPINYRQFLLKWEEYLLFSPFTQQKQEYPLLVSADEPKALQVNVEIYTADKSECECNYLPCSTQIKKEKWLKFMPLLSFIPMLPYTVKFTVENHGVEARTDNESSEKPHGNHEKTYRINTQQEHRRLVHWEHTLYRGLHYMIIEVKTHEGLTHRTRQGVYVS
jgi:adenylate cyclase